MTAWQLHSLRCKFGQLRARRRAAIRWHAIRRSRYRSTPLATVQWEILDETLVEAGRYIVASEPTLAVLAVWTAHAHIVHNPQVKLQKSPRLAISAREKGSGKTVTLEVVACLSPRARASSSYTASSVFRSLAADHPTLCLDEANVLLRDETKSDIVSVLNCGDRRASAWIDRSVPTPKGG